jgi:hypothetical protein
MAKLLKMLSKKSRGLLAKLGELDEAMREAMWAYDEVETGILSELTEQAQIEPEVKQIVGRRLLALDKPLIDRVASAWRPARVRRERNGVRQQ